MIWNDHSDLRGCHAFLSPSQSRWLRYDMEKLEQVYLNMQAKERGTKIHELASQLIEFSIGLPKNHKTLNMFVNDAIGYGMESERVLYYSANCFGTADAISYSEKFKRVRIHDLKTGLIPAKMDQLAVYAALFCLEYNKKPKDLEIIMRIYQFDDILEEHPESDYIDEIINQIIISDKTLNKIGGR